MDLSERSTESNHHRYASANAHQPPVDQPYDGHPHHDAADATPHPSRISLPSSYNQLGGPKGAVAESTCNWALLSAELTFLYVDPLLAAEFDEHADLLSGESLLTFIHPEERESARNDLGNVLGRRELHGSVTRCRYARVPHARELLAQRTVAGWSEDDNYNTVDVVINWAAEGVILCFLHTVLDASAGSSTQWCRTADLGYERADILHQRLLSAVHQSGDISRVFQILRNSVEREMLVSWPPSPAHALGERDFARIGQEVQLNAASDPRTTCTRRFKAHRVYEEGTSGATEVESVFIPHGSLIFACHRVNSRNRVNSDASTRVSYGTQESHPIQQYYGTYSQPQLPHVPFGEYDYAHSATTTSPTHPQFGYGSWTSNHVNSSGDQSHYDSWSAPDQSISPGQPHPSTYSAHGSPYPASTGSSYGDGPSPTSRQFRYRSRSPHEHPNTDNVDEQIPSAAGPNASIKSTRRSSPSNVRDVYSGTSGRNSGLPPAGVDKCASCGVSQSPEWRKGPNGKKDLCNACGLRYARSRAKKEGTATHRRKKSPSSLRDEANAEIPAFIKEAPSNRSTPDFPKEQQHAAPLVTFSGVRRGSTDVSGRGSPLGRATQLGSDTYAHGLAGPGIHGTPSPSPPAGSLAFGNYAYGAPANGALRYADSNGAYYDSALASSGVSDTHGMNALPRMSQYSQYSADHHHNIAAPAPVSGSASVVASFERGVGETH